MTKHLKMAAPKFVETDVNELLKIAVADYESRTGFTLSEASVESQILNTVAYLLYVYNAGVQYACEQMLVEYAVAPALDELGKIVGVTRLPASPATTTIRFNMASGHTGVIIPIGTRVRSTDGKVTFSTSSESIVSAGTDTVDIVAAATETGTIGNGYSSGTITSILDPQAFIDSASNITATSGGGDLETDDSLRQRIKAAPSSFSTAGSREAYEFYAKSASSSIIDVAVRQITPGTVGVYPLVPGGNTSQEVLNLVTNALNADRVRPETDTVSVLAPAITSYSIDISVVTLDDAVANDVVNQVTTNINAFVAANESTLGNDVMISQLIAAAASVEGVYNVTINSPVANIVIPFNGIAVNNSVVVTATGTNEG